MKGFKINEEFENAFKSEEEPEKYLKKQDLEVEKLRNSFIDFLSILYNSKLDTDVKSSELSTFNDILFMLMMNSKFKKTEIKNAISSIYETEA
ncbi:hypothetical protein [Methanococcus voltae]|uniref:Uncharacterized protein n=1 Tax=Methanococcus voltae (strain ATCC BAA-1334 / A3) TaxID=456320 RepID=D7DSJ8_METV3|nr:hypothetical protein [Methanococcus voltae]MCS3901707.1 hypothetical protein [Methanococcus voltae]